jgi:hypothetical protein
VSEREALFKRMKTMCGTYQDVYVDLLFNDIWEAACRTVSGQEAVARYDLSGEFMKRSATGEWIRFDDAAPIPATDQEKDTK